MLSTMVYKLLKYCVLTPTDYYEQKKLKNAAYADTFLVVNYVCENEESSRNHKYTCVSGDGVQLPKSSKHSGPSVLIRV